VGVVLRVGELGRSVDLAQRGVLFFFLFFFLFSVLHFHFNLKFEFESKL
jgi:hypothetical protein